MTNTDLERALAAPETVFRRPAEVVADAGIKDEDKVAILLSWQNSLVALQRASEENMLREAPKSADAGAVGLAEVTKALSALGHSGDAAAPG